MKSSTAYRSQGRRLTANDLAERLLPDLHMNEFIGWAPDLFAFTSYMMSNTGAYQLVVSPPTKASWEPTNKELKDWLGIEIKWDEETNKWAAFSQESEEKLQTDKDDQVSISDEERERPNQILNNWLKSFLLDAKDAKKWILEPKGWRFPGHRLAYFSDELKKPLKQLEGNPEKQIYAIAEHIKIHALVGLSSPIKGEGAKELLENYQRKEISKIEEEITSAEDKKIIDKKKQELKDLKDLFEKKTEISLADFLKNDEDRNWIQFVQKLGDDWNEHLEEMTDKEFQLINHALRKEEGNIFHQADRKGRKDHFDNTALSYDEYAENYIGKKDDENPEKEREKELLGILLKNTPPLLLICWAFFYNELNCETFYGTDDQALNVSDLLCNRDEIQINLEQKKRLWRVCQSIFTLHAIADICCTTWGIYPVEEPEKERARWYAEKLLYDKGSLSTVNPERGRVIPKRHNPNVGITLRSISSNLAFHRSSVDVVWRGATETPLENRLKEIEEREKKNSETLPKTLSILLMPFPLDVKAKHFREDRDAEGRVNMSSDYGFFKYNPQEGTGRVQIFQENNEMTNHIIKLIEEAKQELEEDRFVDIVVFPESSLSKQQYEMLQAKLEGKSLQHEIDELDDKRKKIEQKEDKVRARIDTAIQNKEEVAAYAIVPQIDQNIDDHGSTLTELQKKIKIPPSVLIAGVRESPQDIQEEVKLKNTRELENETEENRAAKIAEFKEEIKGHTFFDRNAVYCKYYNNTDEGYDGERYRMSQKFKQYKHHRWQLDSTQIRSYGLSQILEPEKHKIWWEAMKVPRRRVSFLNVGKVMTISHLICEDLARQDPIADLIRHVGPTLVVTLLMDGPQLKNRWSSRYASILSDDPGSSVITLTSFGMVKRYNSPHGLLSRVVALWSESHGQVREIELANGAEAILLTLKCEPKQERTADGREERVPTNTLSLVDVIQIYPPPIVNPESGSQNDVSGSDEQKLQGKQKAPANPKSRGKQKIAGKTGG